MPLGKRFNDVNDISQVQSKKKYWTRIAYSSDKTSTAFITRLSFRHLILSAFDFRVYSRNALQNKQYETHGRLRLRRGGVLRSASLESVHIWTILSFLCCKYYACVWLPGLAVIHDDPNEIESFVVRGADVNSYDRDGNTALLRAGYSLKRACVHK